MTTYYPPKSREVIHSCMLMSVCVPKNYSGAHPHEGEVGFAADVVEIAVQDQSSGDVVVASTWQVLKARRELARETRRG